MATTANEITKILTSESPSPLGHYSQALVHNGLIFVSGQLPVKPNGTHEPNATFEEQVTQALANLLSIVRAAGGTLECVLKVTAYIVGAENWQVFNRTFSKIFGDVRPARSVVPVPALHHGYLIELEALAVQCRSERPRVRRVRQSSQVR